MRKNKVPVVYFSLGTVVMNNLWTQQKQTRIALKRFIAKIARLWWDINIKVIFVSQGKKVLSKYPENWQVFDKVDQKKILAKSDVFVTHGGSNSFHEAILQKVPMIVVPFFGDQLLVGKRVKQLGIGIDLGRDVSIDTKKSKSFLNYALAKRLNKAVFQVLNNLRYKDNDKKIKLNCVSIENLLYRI